jgi:hypothetical protein
MAVNNNGNLLDTAGEVAIDFVYGNFPIQPNDARPDAASATLSTTVTTRVAGRLDPALDNHINALSGWNGYPQYTPNTAGEDVLGATDYVLVPNVLNLTTALAVDAMKDASLTVTTATSSANASGFKATINNIAIASGTATFTTAAAHGFTGNPSAQTVTVSGLTNTQLNGTWLIANAEGSTFTVFNTGFTNVSSTSDSGTVIDSSKVGKIKAQSLAAGQNNVAPGTAVTITAYAAS